MNFKSKAYLQKFLSALPKGERVNYIFQKYITKGLPISDEKFLMNLESVERHFKNFKTYGKLKDVSECTYYEFGAGYDMMIPLLMSLHGFKKLICIDIRNLTFPELISDSINRLKTFETRLDLDMSIIENIPPVKKKNYKEILKEFFRIEYIAPLDGRATGIESNSIDFIISNDTMEHIPENDLRAIMKECYRILNAGGIMSNGIDYKDHWSYFDNSISAYNYLKISRKEWDRLNPSIMHQNRMRNSDYIKIFKETGFTIDAEKLVFPDDAELKQLKDLSVDEYFRKNYSLEELSIKSSNIVLRKIN